MTADDTHPLARFSARDGRAPTPWGKNGWSVFIREEPQLRTAIAYVERHPMKEGLARQDWDFLSPFR